MKLKAVMGAARRGAMLLRLLARPTLFARVLGVALSAENLRVRTTPREAVMTARARGQRAPRRNARERARLKRAILRVDLLFPGGPNCYRRALTETWLDRGASEEKIHFGLDVGTTGHAWLDSDPARQSFDVTFSV